MPVPLVVGNWKMNTTPPEAEALARELIPLLAGVHGVAVALAPPYTSLPAVAAALRGTPLLLAAQDVHWEECGAYTGGISHSMLEALGCVFTLVGHSERRTYFGETDRMVNHKIHATLRGGLRPILCIGEKEDERESGRHREVLIRQIDRGLEDVSPDKAARLVVAYEPVWAVGTGRAAGAKDVAEAHDLVRRRLERIFGNGAPEIRVLYGGSVTPENAAGFASLPEVDGVLVGGASLKPGDFARIVRAGW